MPTPMEVEAWKPFITVQIKHLGNQYAFAAIGHVAATRKFIDWLEKFCPEAYEKLTEKLRPVLNEDRGSRGS